MAPQGGHLGATCFLIGLATTLLFCWALSSVDQSASLLSALFVHPPASFASRQPMHLRSFHQMREDHSKSAPFDAREEISKHPNPNAKAAIAGMGVAAVVGHSAEATAGSVSQHPSAPSEIAVLGFADQMSNIAGPTFASSLFPYLAFLKFVGFKKNQLPPLARFGFQFLLAFVASTIASSIVSKVIYGGVLADSDWLHGSSEALLCITNLMIVLGLRSAFTGTKASDPPSTAEGLGRLAALGYAAGAASCFFLLSGALHVGGNLPTLDMHAPFLGGIGNLPPDTVTNWGLPHVEPVNALSISTWFIHFSSVIEYIVAMHLVWSLAALQKNERWKGLTWGMMPLAGSGLVACSYHFFYNSPAISFMVALQASLTLLGNTTCAVAAYRVAKSNGWTWQELNPFAESEPSAVLSPLVLDAPKAQGLDQPPEMAPLVQDVAKLVTVSVIGSYLIKYGSLNIDLPFQPSPAAALALAGTPLLLLAAYYLRKSPNLYGGKEGVGPTLSMADIKKFGIAGTVAYILTELIFWVLALPCAALLLYKTQGHWPDWASNADRAAVLGFVFAGANIARAALPLRLGAALALAPWVDRNITNRGQQG